MPVEQRLSEVRSAIANCNGCPLSGNIKNKVPAEGPSTARVFVIGEAPGADEDKEGRPFVGTAGKLLMKALEEAGLKRDEVFIHNTLSCRPPNNEFPGPTKEGPSEPITACLTHLLTEINLVRPEVIAIMGKNAYEALFGFSPKLKITEEQGKVYPLRVKTSDLVLATYPAVLCLHPSYVARAGGATKPEFAQLVASLQRAVELSRGETPIPVLFEPGIKRLPEALQTLVTETLRRAPVGFLTDPAAQRQNHHPAWARAEGGLVMHSLAVAALGVHIVRAMGRPQVADEAFAAGLLHDIIKWGYYDNRSDYQNHPPNAAGLIQRVAVNLGLQDDLQVQRVVGAVATHQGQWGPTHPRYWFELATHCADMLASNFNMPHPLDSTLDDLTTVDLMAEFGKFKRYEFKQAAEVLAATTQVARGIAPGYAAG